MDSHSQLVAATLDRTLAGYRSVTESLQTAFSELDDKQFVDSRLATRFILSWMRDLKHYHREFGELFNRRKRPPIADDFTASVAICLNEFLKSRGYFNTVRSEETTHRHRNATRPDVSVRQSSDLLATIECKTNFGWNRNNWQIDHEVRSDTLRELCPDCTTYLCVLTQKNWDSTELRESQKFGTEWFCLCNENVGELESPVPDSAILTPIEPMFIDTLMKLRARPKIEIAT
jgi:hypothetical protein